MGEWIDFRELRSKLKFKDVLEKYGIRLHLRNGGKQAVGPCPLPEHAGGRNKESFSANLEKGVFQCFSCRAKGNALDFACLMDGRNPEVGEQLRKTALALAEHFKFSLPKPSDAGNVAKRKPALAAPRTIVNGRLDFELKGLDPVHEYFYYRKVSPETVALFGLGHCGRGSLAGRIAIPIHDTKGNLVGYAGRLAQLEKPPKEIPKYLFPGKRTHKGITHEFRKSLLLYNTHRIKAPVETLTIVEGFPSVWWLTQNGYPNCVALMGNHMSEEQLKIVLSITSPSGRIILISDGDTAGIELSAQAKKLFAGDARLRVVQLQDTNQPTDLSPAELTECLRAWKDTPAERGGGVSPREGIAELINQFPCFELLGITSETWDAESFEKQTGKFSSGELSVAQFILGVWNPTTTWKCGKFDLIEAAARLDDEHRQPIIDWFSDPWWP